MGTGLPTLVAVTEATGKVTTKSGRTQLVQLIDPGKGSSGYYSAEVLETAATERVFPAGTHMYLDHPTATENEERPERSVKDLAAVLASDATWTGESLVAEVTVFAPYRDAIKEIGPSIGVSIRASAMVSESPEGRIIDRLVPGSGTSVDFVTHAGRGGKVLEVLESARAQVIAHAVAHGVVEATANDTREQLQQLLRDQFGGEKSWVWVRDFDDSTVWYEHETPDSSATYALSYSADDAGVIALSGDPTEVRAQTNYVPATRPDSTTTTESGEVPMGQIQVDESEHKAAVEKAGRVDALETERDTEKARADAAEQALAEAKKSTAPRTPRQVMEDRDKDLRSQVAQLSARESARAIIDVELSEAWLAPTTIARLSAELLESLPIVNDELDVNALRARCVEKRDQHEVEAAESLTAAGVGTPRGLGAMHTPALEATAAKVEEDLTEAFKSFGLSETAAATAVKGR